MKSPDKRIIWKEKDDLSLLMLINQVIDKYGIENIRQYQNFLNEHPKDAPSTWFINDRFGSWDKLLLTLGKKPYERYKWNSYSEPYIQKQPRASWHIMSVMMHFLLSIKTMYSWS